MAVSRPDNPGRAPLGCGLSSILLPTFIAALLDLGEVDAARAQLSRFRQAAADRGLNLPARIMSLQAYLSACEGRTERAVVEYRQSIRLMSRDVPLLDRAFIHHAFGYVLQAGGDRREAVDQLRVAHSLFMSVGAAPYVQRVEETMARDGIGAPITARHPALDLTDREGDVVTTSPGHHHLSSYDIRFGTRANT